ncbi:hypothetical protein M011DRAFT_457647 [Sporormia fimetaria CBS 119925]|uniref:Uncharacterized protein n=1 Tax=Sporormia fimetaria CBS 119925 TaxID=1340428 RepID=A0A6A6VCJ6_9PLEO|nr:hypothetical protein M011DRAFT_457647 [Sporormia fimetaria CBS 119925]
MRITAHPIPQNAELRVFTPSSAYCNALTLTLENPENRTFPYLYKDIMPLRIRNCGIFEVWYVRQVECFGGRHSHRLAKTDVAKMILPPHSLPAALPARCSPQVTSLMRDATIRKQRRPGYHRLLYCLKLPTTEFENPRQVENDVPSTSQRLMSNPACCANK